MLEQLALRERTLAACLGYSCFFDSRIDDSEVVYFGVTKVGLAKVLKAELE